MSGATVKYGGPQEYGVRWREWSRGNRLVSRERTFTSLDALNRFTAELERQADFHEYVSWLFPDMGDR